MPAAADWHAIHADLERFDAALGVLGDDLRETVELLQSVRRAPAPVLSPTHERQLEMAVLGLLEAARLMCRGAADYIADRLVEPPPHPSQGEETWHALRELRLTYLRGAQEAETKIAELHDTQAAALECHAATHEFEALWTRLRQQPIAR